MTTRIRSHAKINLGLAIGPARTDGYHALTTVYQTLAIHDFVTVTAEPLAASATSQIVITCNDPRVPCDARNTCWKIVELTLLRMKVSARVTIHIDKRLPIQGGLGAGSANAAATLIGLERELQGAVSKEDRMFIAAKVGSDVPLFLVGGTVLGRGRGEQVHPLPDLPLIPCVLAVPEIGVSTPLAFREWDRLQTENSKTAENKLTANGASDRLEQLGRVWAAALSAPQEPHANATGVFPAESVKDRAGNLLLELVRTGIENDFESVVFTLYPSLRGILETLKNDSSSKGTAVYAALSGSGSAMFGLYESMADSHAAAKRLAQRGVPAYETELLGRDEYWRNMVDE